VAAATTPTAATTALGERDVFPSSKRHYLWRMANALATQACRHFATGMKGASLRPSLSLNFGRRRPFTNMCASVCH
jgi:hypothetical protein